jgi:hypothetical protein
MTEDGMGDIEELTENEQRSPESSVLPNGTFSQISPVQNRNPRRS